MMGLKVFYCVLLIRGDSSINGLDTLVIFFLVDKLLRISHFGIYFPKETAFFRRSWSTISFIVVSITFFTRLILLRKDIDLIPLNLFGLLRTFKNKKLISLLARIEKAVLLLLETFVLVFSILLFFAIVGLQTFNQLLDHQCFDPSTGKALISLFCGNAACPENMVCGILWRPPQPTNFDNLSNSFLQVIRVVTLERWVYLMNDIQRTYTNYIWIYFFTLVILGIFKSAKEEGDNSYFSEIIERRDASNHNSSSNILFLS